MDLLSLGLLSSYPRKVKCFISHGPLLSSLQHLLLEKQLNICQRAAQTIIMSLFNQVEHPHVSKIVTSSEILVGSIVQIYKQAMPCQFH